MINLNAEDLQRINQSLQYAKKNISESDIHPDYSSKHKSLNEIDETLAKVRQLIKEASK